VAEQRINLANKMEMERLLYDSGRIPLLLLAAISVMGLLSVYALMALARQSLVAAAGLGAFALFLFSAWFWRYRLYHDSVHQELVIRRPLWFARRLSLADAASFVVRDVGGPLTSAVSGTQIWLRYADGRRIWLTKVRPGDPEGVAARFSEAVSLPMASEDGHLSARSRIAGPTVIVVLMMIGSFWSHQPGVILWPFRAFCLMAFLGLWHGACRKALH